MHKRVLTKNSKQEEWLAVYRDIDRYVSRGHIGGRLLETLGDITRKTKGRKAVYAWSGGKDSIPLGYLMQIAGIRAGVLAVTALDWPEFSDWLAVNTPEGIEAIDTGQDLDWLAQNQGLCFPENKKIQYRWAVIVQQAAQKQYYKRVQPDMMLFGRRGQDGNYTGPKGSNIYTTRAGEVHYNPLAGWSHEEILACIRYYDLSLPPCYFYPNGFKTGAGAWAKMVSVGSDFDNWSIIWRGDKRVVQQAAGHIESARQYINGSVKE